MKRAQDSGHMVLDGTEISDAKALAVLQSNDVNADVSADGAVTPNGHTDIVGGTGIAGLTLAAPSPGARVSIRVASISSGTVVLTTAAGVTFDGTNNTATFDAAGEALVLRYKSATAWQIEQNVGAVALSAV